MLRGGIVTSEVAPIALHNRPSQTARLHLRKGDLARTEIVVIMVLFKGVSILPSSRFESTAG